jgi:predicted membrane-bound spermidine synthase
LSDAAPTFARTPASLDFLACAAAGLASVGAELALVRLLAPWFGQSNLVWANAVGVVLAALALGAFVGGRLADRAPTSGALAATLSAAAIGLAAAALLGPVVGAWLAPSDLGGDRPLPLSFHGSLAATLILLGPAVLATGMIGPVCVRRLSARLGPGRAAGWVSAATTVGGLVACVCVPTVLVPGIGSRRVIAGAGLLLGAVAAAYALRGDGVPAARVAAAGPAVATGSRPGRWVVALAHTSALLAGLVITMLEFGAVRALAPRFGQASATYATVIGVVIAALAVGNAIGGALARRPRGGALLGLAIGAMVFVPTLARASESESLLLVASGFGVPVLVVGIASPLLVRATASPGRVGRAAGAIFAVGTVGSLLGCYLAPLWALPDMGTAWTIQRAGLAGIAALGIAFALGRRAADLPEPTERAPEAAPAATARGGPRAAALAACLVAAAALVVGRGPLREDAGQIEERESAYQTVRVVEETAILPAPLDTPLASAFFAEPREVKARFVRFDEDLGSYQSLVFEPGTVGTGGRYYDHLAVGAWFDGMPWTRPGDARSAPRVLIVGYAGGTLHRVLRDTAPDGRAPHVTGVEIDPEVVALARKHLRLGELEGDRLDLVVGEDGRAALAKMPADRRFDLVLVDAYQRTQYVPFHLATEEFFRLCQDHLSDTGALGINVHAPSGLSGRLLRSLAQTLASRTRRGVWIVPNPQYPGSATLWWTKSGRAPRLPVGVPAALEVPAFAIDRLLVRHDPDGDPGEVWTDDRAPVERLMDEALRREAVR